MADAGQDRVRPVAVNFLGLGYVAFSDPRGRREAPKGSTITLFVGSAGHRAAGHGGPARHDSDLGLDLLPDQGHRHPDRGGRHAGRPLRAGQPGAGKGVWTPSDAEPLIAAARLRSRPALRRSAGAGRWDWPRRRPACRASLPGSTVATPLLGAALLRQRIRGTTWAAVGLATVGLAVLSLTGVSTGYGELLTVASAVVYAGHILALADQHARHGPRPEPGPAGGDHPDLRAAGRTADLRGRAQLPASGRDWLVVAYLGLVAGAVTMVLQTWAQARIDPT